MGQSGLFQGGGAFQRELRTRVDAELSPELRRRGARQMAAKTVVIMGWAIGSYLGLVLWATEPWQVVALCISLALAVAGIGFSIQHDANHGAYARSRRANRALGLSLDLMGASSYVWKAKHNHAHHSFTNVAGADTDIEQMPFARLAPDQPLHTYHRWQYLYMWPLYGFFAIRHHLFGDIREVVTGRIGIVPLPRLTRGELALYVGGKLAFWSWALVIPLLLHPWWAVLPAFALTSWTMGIILAVTFQLAHCVEEADFTSVDRLKAGPSRDWATHQAESTVDFATRNRLLGWYLGGLNFQIEHHLLPRVCHVHYGRLMPVVREVCARHGVRHTAQPTLRSALASHGRWLRHMGTAPAAV